MTSSGAAEGQEAPAGEEYRSAPRVLVLADTEASRERCLRIARLAGCRVAAAEPLRGGGERIELQIAADAVMVEVEADPGEVLEAIVDRLEEGARNERFGSVIVAPPELIDPIAARSFHRGVHHLVGPTDLERVAALASAASRPQPRFHDVNKSPATARLQQLSEEVGRVATILASLSEDEAAATALVGGEVEERGADRIEAGQIRAIIRARRLRDHFFRSELFADPAWDMLLDLMAARIERAKVAVSSLCIAAAVPPTTALRWIKALCDQGIFARIADPEDGRRVFIELTDQTAAAMENYLKAAQRISPQIV
jgi:hypothetical protein